MQSLFQSQRSIAIALRGIAPISIRPADCIAHFTLHICTVAQAQPAGPKAPHTITVKTTH